VGVKPPRPAGALGSQDATDSDEPPVYDEDKLWSTGALSVEPPDAHLSVLASAEDRSRSPGDRWPVDDHAGSL